METLTITRVREDANFFQIELMARSEGITARTRSNTTSRVINELAARLAGFPLSYEDRYIWECGERGKDSAAVSLEFWCESKFGIIAIEVYMRTDDEHDPDRRDCRFCTRTEIGLLNEFGKSLEKLAQSGVGHAVTLRRH